MQRVADGLARNGSAVRIYASRIDDQPFTRLNTTLKAQRFEPFFRDGVETRPMPLSTMRRAMMWPSAIGAIPGADRVIGYDRVRDWTLGSLTTPLASGFKPEIASADLVHAWGAEPVMYGPWNAARSQGKPFVVTPFAHPGHWGDDPLNARLYKRADAVIALLPGEAAFYESLGVKPETIHVIPVGAPPLQQGSSIEVSGRVVLCLGVKRRYKYKALLDAIPLIQNQDVRFAFVGPETPESSEDFAATTDPRIIRVGKVDEPDKWGWLHAAEVMCLPSVSEILPVSVLEAWRTSTAVVVAEGRFTRDLVTDAEDGIVCAGDSESIAKAVEEALADPDRLTAMGRAGAATVAERFEPAKVVAQHEALYATLV